MLSVFIHNVIMKRVCGYILSLLMHKVTLHIILFYAVMLKWFVEGQIVAAAIKSPGNYPIEEEGVETKPEMVPVAVLHENVDVHLIWRHDAWLVVTSVMKQKQQNPSFICKSCYHNLDEQPSVVCEHCLSWYHMKCVPLKQQRYWYCCDCHNCPFD